MNKKRSGAEYHPLYFLAALGNGGLAVSFFLYPMFMIEHPGYPMITFDHILPFFNGGNILVSALLLLALGCILFFAYHHFRLLFWNLREYGAYKKTAGYQDLKSSNAEVSLMAIPLTLAMSINVSFILGAVFVPGLWNYVEYLFPFAILGFLAVGVYGLNIFITYFTRIIANGQFDFGKNNNLSQLIAVFAFAMISVGLAAPAAMSHTLAVSVTAAFAAIFFASAAVTLAIITLVLGFKSILRYGFDQQSSPTIWVIIPIITVLGIAFVRLTMGVYHNLLHKNPEPAGLFVMLSALLSVQIIFGLIGYFLLKQNRYFADFVHGEKLSAGSYTLICPGVAFFVLGMFFISWGLVETHVLSIFSPVYFIILAPFALIQLKTIRTLFKLNKKLLPKYGAGSPLVPATKIRV